MATDLLPFLRQLVNPSNYDGAVDLDSAAATEAIGRRLADGAHARLRALFAAAIWAPAKPRWRAVCCALSAIPAR
jgi:hypothetical protein